jgi:2-phosphosulfolactate phosphatase
VTARPLTVELAWGAAGARALSVECDVVVLVDVLSFTTAVSVALSCGASVRPVDPDAQLPTLSPGDVLAGPRDGPGPTLSPATLPELRPGQRLLLPSRNGAAIGSSFGKTAAVAASLRNAGAVAEWLSAHGGRIGVVAAGERDDEGGWRPSYEDAVGAGAVVAHLDGARQSPQVAAAVSAYDAARSALAERLRACRSGVELAQQGFEHDVDIAAELDADRVVPVWRDGSFVAHL